MNTTSATVDFARSSVFPQPCLNSSYDFVALARDGVTWAGNANAVFPCPAGHYAGQLYGGHASGADAPGNLSVRAVDGISPVVGNALNPAFTATNYGNTLYNVVRDAESNGTDAHAAALQNIFGGSGWICNDPVAAADTANYGFQVLPM